MQQKKSANSQKDTPNAFLAATVHSFTSIELSETLKQDYVSFSLFLCFLTLLFFFSSYQVAIGYNLNLHRPGIVRECC